MLNQHLLDFSGSNKMLAVQIVRKKPSPFSPSHDDVNDDLDTEDALKDFDFLSSTEAMDTSPDSRLVGDGTDWGETLEAEICLRRHDPMKWFSAILINMMYTIYTVTDLLVQIFIWSNNWLGAE